MANWRKHVQFDPTELLLETDCPPIRYWTLVELLNRKETDVEVVKARGQCLTYPRAVDILSQQALDGLWYPLSSRWPKTRDDALKWYRTASQRTGILDYLPQLLKFGFNRNDPPVQKAIEVLIQYLEEPSAAYPFRAAFLLAMTGLHEIEGVQSFLQKVIHSQKSDGSFALEPELHLDYPFINNSQTFDMLLFLAQIPPFVDSGEGNEILFKAVSFLMTQKFSCREVGGVRDYPPLAEQTMEAWLKAYDLAIFFIFMDLFSKLKIIHRFPKLQEWTSWLISQQREDGTFYFNMQRKPRFFMAQGWGKHERKVADITLAVLRILNRID